MLESPEFWVGVAFIGFVLVLLWKQVPKLIAKSLDARAEAIRKELEEARSLKQEALELLADYERRRKEAGKEAEAIIAQARSEAQALAAETEASLKESLERRTRLAEEKIARAQAQAASEVRAAAVDAAIAAAEKIIGSKVSGSLADGLVEQSIRELKSKLN
jgi:F-type H+-transporting ATPase subunit b